MDDTPPIWLAPRYRLEWHQASLQHTRRAKSEDKPAWLKRAYCRAEIPVGINEFEDLNFKYLVDKGNYVQKDPISVPYAGPCELKEHMKR